MRHFFHDLETLPAIHLAPEERAVLEAVVKEGRNDNEFARTALDWRSGWILSVGGAFEAEEPWCVYADYDGCVGDYEKCLAAETAMLKELQDRICPWAETWVWVGFNNLEFDERWAFLHALRAKLLGLCKAIPYKKWDRRARDIATMLQGPNPRGTMPKMDDVAKFLRLPGKPEGVSGGRVWDLWQNGEHEIIKMYQKSDIRETRDIYREFYRVELYDHRRVKTDRVEEKPNEQPQETQETTTTENEKEKG